jgi:glycosyltransferase involved in cell wall biosynthesis
MIPGICVVGRLDFDTGYGRHTLAALELLSRYYPVWFRASREAFEGAEPVKLPSGRLIERASESDTFANYFMADIPWNGFEDTREFNFPKGAFRVAHLAWDSSRFPEPWVSALNTSFDVVLFTSDFLVDAATESGVVVPLGVLPLGLDLTELLTASPGESEACRTIFGAVSAYHSRKNLPLVIEAFVAEFAPHEAVSLKLHSNLAMGTEFDRVETLSKRYAKHDIQITHGSLTEHEKNLFISEIDVYVNASSGEGYSIGPREALAAGKVVIVSDIPGHKDLVESQTVFAIDSAHESLAIYPELGGLAIGKQAELRIEDIRVQMRKAFELSHTQRDEIGASGRRFASHFDYERICQKYKAIFCPDDTHSSLSARFADNQLAEFIKKIGRLGTNAGAKRLVVPLHDAGYFSIFNVFMANLVWSEFDPSIHIVIPDWRSSALLESLGGKMPTSYCYSKPSDGNLWNLIYEPLFGLSDEEMNDPAFLGVNKVLPATPFVEDREPLLTYINAYDLYRAPWFGEFRRLYNRILREHVRLLPHFQRELEAELSRRKKNVFRIAAHVRHPSHAIEQPGGKMAGIEEYVAVIRQVLAEEGISEASSNWEFFVASDNARSINAFVKEFGERVTFVQNVARVDEAQHEEFDALDDKDRHAEGYQIQHLNAADSDRWSHLNVFEVWRDAELLAASDVLLHAVSNVATAAAFMNPEVRMVFCDPKLG